MFSYRVSETTGTSYSRKRRISHSLDNLSPEKLRGNNMFVELQGPQPNNSNCLIVEVAEKTMGVFLWVRLIVLLLLRGLLDGNSISNL